MAGQKPRKGWIYDIDPKRVILRCKRGHEHMYDISGPEELDCSYSSCDLKINSSRIMRGQHPYIVWSEYDYGWFHTYHAIPLTSKETFKGLPTAYPIRKNGKNGLDFESLALVHQLTMIDPECFKNRNGDWMNRRGVINPNEREDIEERLKVALDLSNSPSEDWFIKNASPELLKKIFGLMDQNQREEALSQLLDSV